MKGVLDLRYPFFLSKIIMAKKKNLKLKSRAELAKKYKRSMTADNMIAGEDSLWLPSSQIALNSKLGGGLLYGRIMELFGEESSGKTLLAYDFAKNTIKLGGIVLWVDAEGAYTTTWAESNGLDNSRVELFSETGVEIISDWIYDMVTYHRSLLTNNEPILLVVDSTAALDTAESREAEHNDAKAEMGTRAKAIYKMLRARNLVLNDMGACSIFINQIRKKVGASMFEDPDTTPGGKSLAFFASIRLAITRGKQIKNSNKQRIGQESHMRIVKNKIAPPASTLSNLPVYFDAKFGMGIGYEPLWGLADVLQDSGVLTRKKGASRYYMGETMIANGEEGLIKELKKNDKLRKKLIRKAGINTVDRTRRQLKKITENLYPVD